jgi:hypothetical protein
MSKIALSGNASGTGTFTIASPDSNSDRTLNLPDAGGTIQVSGNPISGTTGTFTGLVDISAAGAGQIQFPATQNASANANTLDDYEEGTWTPSLGGNTTYTNQFGFYRKVGSLVFISAYLEVNVLGTGSNAVIDGLPFNPTQASSQHECVFTVSKSLGLSLSVTSISLRNNGTSIYATYRTASSVDSTVNGAYIANGTELNFSGCYIIF